MGQDFLRRVDGYNFPFIETNGDANTIRNAWVSVPAPAGPGRIESGNIYIHDVVDSTVRGNHIRVTIDGVVIISNTIQVVLGIIDAATIRSPWCSRVTGTTFTAIHWLLNLDYESSADVAIQNTTSPNPDNFRISIQGRGGR